MHDLLQANLGSLTWVQPKGSDRTYELRSGEMLFGSLAFLAPFNPAAIGRTAHGRWRLNREGVLYPRIGVRAEGQDEEVAVYQTRVRGPGVLTLTDGQSFTWKSTDYWSTRWMLVDGEGQPALILNAARRKRLSDLFKMQAVVDLHAAGGLGDQLPLLLIVSFYLLLHHHSVRLPVIQTAEK